MICNEIHQLYKEDPENHIQYRMFKWLLELAARIGDSKEFFATVVDLNQLPPEKDKIESAVMKYFRDNWTYLFFKNDQLWTVLGDCHCKNYAEKLQPVSLVNRLFDCYAILN